jgi:hypothetical protein
MNLIRPLLKWVVIAGVVTASNAWGNTLRIDRISGHFTGVGGEFTLLPIDPGDLNPYVDDYDSQATYTYTSGEHVGKTGIQTFCIEYNEHVGIPATYNYNLSDSAIKGGTTTGDPVSAGVGYLYSQFAQGSLSGYNYTVGSGRNSSAGTLQNAIWWLEGEISLSGAQVAANTFLGQVAAVFGSAAAGKADVAIVGSDVVNAAFYGVGAVNMGSAPVYPNQDQLYWFKTGNTQVPDGGITLILLGMGAACLTFAQRRLGRAS